MPVLFNIVAYQIAWFACVLGAANQLPWIGTSIALAVVALHLALVQRRGVEVKLILAAAVIGLILDSALASAGLVSFTSGVWIDGIAPHWMVGLWIAFATTLNISMRWLVTRPALAVVFGALGGPVAYCAGAKLGAIAINPSATTFIAIGLVWAAAMWLLTLAVAHINNPSTAMERAI